MSDDILNSSVTDPRGEKVLSELAAQDLSVLSVDELKARIASLEGEIARVKTALDGRGDAVAAAEALFS